MQKKKLRGITPYNDSWFRTCYYHQLIAALSYFGVPAEQVILNSEFNVLSANGWNDFAYEEKNIISDDDFAEWTGVKLHRHNAEYVIDATIKGIDANRPVIVGQDNFCLPQRKAMYRKQHCAHFILVYGYNRKERTFTVCEHEYINSYDFCEKTMPFEVLEEAYNGFRNEFKDFKWSVMEFGKLDSPLPFLQKARISEKIFETYRARDYSSYMAPYRLMEKISSENAEDAWKTYNVFAQLFRTLETQCKTFFGNAELCEKLNGLWRRAQFVSAVACKAVVCKDLKYLTPDVLQVKIGEMEILMQEVAELARCL